MKPEHGLDKHVDRSGQVVPVTDMTELVRDHGLELTRREVLLNAGGEQQDRPEESDDGGLQHARR